MSEPSANPMRRALRALSHGVYVLSVNDTGHDDYLVVSLAMQCSVEPPQVAFALSVNARILPALRTAAGAVLGVLGADEQAAVRRYGAPGGVRQPPSNPARSSTLHAIPPEVSFWLELQVAAEAAAGDHILFIANVVGAGVRDGMAHTSPAAAAAGDETTGMALPAERVAFHALVLAESGFPYAG